ncbi:glycerol-3-phosphate dehydrogenase subunit GlpB [Odoribacter laneus]|uniref:glycerol-3-phosphate dehydrogenase subunit GlpB n=1 Tax=Odoribacter laneus TaxID=626933 RepID=UPI0023F24DEC|nr:glycerol-3-phosphate dehydrogenase subunit GlpB [Odoribacter laneus]
MKFDTIIVGGGLAGLLCGIRLSKEGQRCVVISAGQSALHFSSGSFDLLNALPDGTPVRNPLAGVEELIRQQPLHPYAKLGKEKFGELAVLARELLLEAGIAVKGEEKANHYRVTPMGNLKPTWLTLKDLLACESDSHLPWKKIAIFNVLGFLDFYTQFIADEFRKMGTESSIHSFNFPVLECIRKNPTEMRSTNIARLFDKQENLEELIRLLKTESGEAEAIILPAIVGLGKDDVVEQLQEKVGKTICLLPTLPPSVPGIHTQQQLRKYFQHLGGVYMLGDTVLRAEKEGRKVVRVYSYNHGDIPFVGKNVVLATGSFFSQGLIATSERIYEPVFDLDVSFSKDREQWYNLDLFAAQPYQTFGVKTDDSFRAMYRGQAFENLYVAGAVLEGFNAMKEGCGAGVSVLSALSVAERILSK